MGEEEEEDEGGGRPAASALIAIPKGKPSLPQGAARISRSGAGPRSAGNTARRSSADAHPKCSVYVPQAIAEYC
eukprot:3246143-Pyramimonas_sp.AAC.1